MTPKNVQMPNPNPKYKPPGTPTGGRGARMRRYRCWNCLTNHDGDYERCDSCISKGREKPSMWRAGPNYVPPTNADKLRDASDEELVKMLCAMGWEQGEEDECREWLQQPAEEETP